MMNEQVSSEAHSDPAAGFESGAAAQVAQSDDAVAEPAVEPEAPQDRGEAESSEEPTEALPLDDLAGSDPALEAEPSLEVILNIPVTLSMELGRTRMTIRELMELRRGSVVKFDRLVGEPMDVLVNGTLIAHGEVVVINDKFGIRLIDVISPAERVRKLR